MLDIVNSPPELKDFFAFFGTRGDVGSQADLALLKSSIRRQSSGPSRVDTVMIEDADHMYTGEEAQVARVIAGWADGLAPIGPGTKNVPDRR